MIVERSMAPGWLSNTYLVAAEPGREGFLVDAGGPVAPLIAKADELGAKSLALVAFGTGVGGFPIAEAARIEAEEVRRHLDEGSGLDRVVFAVFGDEAREAFERAVAAA